MKKSSADSTRVNSASLIDLKAELFRKQEEFKSQKLQNESTGYIRGKPSTSTKKPSLFSKKNVGVTERAEKDYEEKAEEENVFERSRKALESKAKLYEKISSGAEIAEEDGSGLFLVDFQKKTLDEFELRLEREKREKEEREKKEIEEEKRLLAKPVPPPDDEDDEWVDYVDAFGRSRRCLKRDLPDLRKQDQILHDKKRKMDEKAQKGLKDFQDLRDKSAEPSLMSNDMKRELDRQKWEEGERQKMEEEKQGPIHYADVQHNEVRTHGVGFYKFDKEESIRQEQMEQLNKLRQETKDERSKSERIKEKRKAALAARLAKVKQRKREKLGLPLEDDEDDKKGSDEDIGPQLSEQARPEPEPLTRDDSWRTTIKSTREWDKGKQVSLERSEQNWLEKQRAEREEEFAPPSFYYDTPTPKSGTAQRRDCSSCQGTKKGDLSNNVEEQLSKIRASVEAVEQTSNYEAKDSSYGGSQQTDSSEKQISGKPSDGFNVNSGSHGMSESDDRSQTVSHGSGPPANSGQPVQHTGYANMTGPSAYFPNFSIPPPQLLNSQPHWNVPATSFSGLSQNVNDSQPLFSVPPPNFNIPPPNINLPPPNFNATPTNLNIPVCDTFASMATPASNSSFPTGSSLPPMSSACNQTGYLQSVTLSETTQFGSSLTTSAGAVDQNRSAASQNVETNQPKRKFVAKLDIVDTRLMEGD